MYNGLQQKPFYFLTDRQTSYQFLVDNRDKKAVKKYVYYPQEYQKMSCKSIQKNKQSVVRKFLVWTLGNQSKLEFNDKKTANSMMMNSLIIIVICGFGAKSLRKLLFRTQLPVLQIKLQRMGFNIRLFKAFTSYIGFSWLAYRFIKNQLKQTHLTDLAFEYKYHFAEKMHSKADDLFYDFWQERVKSKVNQVV